MPWIFCMVMPSMVLFWLPPTVTLPGWPCACGNPDGTLSAWGRAKPRRPLSKPAVCLRHWMSCIMPPIPRKRKPGRRMAVPMPMQRSLKKIYWRRSRRLPPLPVLTKFMISSLIWWMPRQTRTDGCIWANWGII